MRGIIREPLFQFLFIGAILFGVYSFMQSGQPEVNSSKEIQLSLDELTQLTQLFQSQWRRPPTQQELQNMIENKVQQEVLYREALEMGLDKEDEIIKRRMAQKMQFLAEDVAAAREPSSEELRSWYQKNTAKFTLPKRVSFRHLYFSPDVRGTNALEDASKLLAKLQGQPEDVTVDASSADPFMFHDYYRDRATDFLGKEFGPQFALAVDALPTGSWQGPVESGFGWHLVFVDAEIPGRIPDFEEVEGNVKTAWLAEQKIRAWDETYRKIRAKYSVLMPVPVEVADSKSNAAQ